MTFVCKIKGTVTSDSCYDCFLKQSPKAFLSRVICKKENVVSDTDISVDSISVPVTDCLEKVVETQVSTRKSFFSKRKKKRNKKK